MMQEHHAEDKLEQQAGAQHAHHGGIGIFAGALEFELVANPETVTLYVFEAEAPVATTGGSANLTIISGTQESAVYLKPAGDNKFEGSGDFRLSAKAKIKVLATVSLPGEKPSQVQFDLH